jgi:hypothetical protein
MSVMSGGGILDIIQRRNPETEFDILKQIGSGTYGEVYKVSTASQARLTCMVDSLMVSCKPVMVNFVHCTYCF